jgi:hypothetical protein
VRLAVRTIGEVHRARGCLEDAGTYLEESLALARATGDPTTVRTAWRAH